MMKDEFEGLIGKEIDEKSYKRIEYVYTWHPSIKNVGGKEQIAQIYLNGGMLLIDDMYPSAQKGQEMSEDIDRLRRKLEHAQLRYNKFKENDRSIEELIDLIDSKHEESENADDFDSFVKDLRNAAEHKGDVELALSILDLDSYAR